jgi:hypothetical protein
VKKIVACKVLENYRVWLRFDDGVEGEVDFSAKPRTGVFSAWNDYAFFRRAAIDEFGTPEWPGELDLCPDALWLQVTGKKPEDLFPRLRIGSSVHAHAHIAVGSASR